MKYNLEISSFAKLNNNIEFGLYKNYFILNIENNLGTYIYIKKILNNYLIFLNKYKYFFKSKEFIGFLKNISKNIKYCTYGFFIELILIGLGYKLIRYRKYRLINFELQFSHKVFLKIPSDIIIKTSKKNIIIFGLNKDRVKDIGVLIINLRFPNIYKGTGIRYLNQIIKLKPGKQR